MERRTASSLARGAVVSPAILFLAYGGAAAQSRQHVPDRPADTSVQIETLSATQRNTMPDSTNVILPGGRTVSLAAEAFLARTDIGVEIVSTGGGRPASGWSSLFPRPTGSGLRAGTG